MSTRATVLAKIRAALKAEAGNTARKAAAEARLAAPERGVVPQRGQLPLAERIALFKDLATKTNATVSEIDGYEALPAEIGHYLRARNLPSELRMGADPRLAGVPWEREKTLTVQTGASDGSDTVGLSHALGAIAESGTLALISGGDNPTTLNFLPDHHIVVVAKDDVAGDMETIWDRIRAEFGRGALPRAVNFVSGPSRSADIEQTILLGAHGPRALHIVIVDRASSAES